MLSLWLAIKKYSWPVSTKRLFVDITGYSVWCLYKKVSYPPIFLVIFSISENDKLTCHMKIQEYKKKMFGYYKSALKLKCSLINEFEGYI